MQTGITGGPDNPNAVYFNSRGIWITYVIVLAFLHYMILSLPFLSVPVAWTTTNILHNFIQYFILHIEKGTPFETNDQGKFRFVTVWEQMDFGEQFSSSKKFLTVVPIVLFIIASFYTQYDKLHFIINSVSLLLFGLIPKLPMFHGVRIFGINKY